MPGHRAVAVARGSVQVPTVARNPSAWLVACSIMLMTWRPGAIAPGVPGSGSQGTVTLVNRVRATMRGVSCADCGARLEAALAKRLDPATITVGPTARSRGGRVRAERDPVFVGLLPKRRREAGGEVLSVQIEACGTIETTQQGSWMTSGSTGLLLEGPGTWTSRNGGLRHGRSSRRLGLQPGSSSARSVHDARASMAFRPQIRHEQRGSCW